ncbi:Mobile element protein [hydrothermal vent metagenome]|uniref:Mobile element protein n=1 Tax=hydrothermal vent metagenome TaxID=652676 RepID=A0A3B0URW8_9ZZZZ
MIKEIIRLKTEDLSNSRIAKALNLSRPTVIKYVKQFEASGFSLHELSKLSNQELHEFFEATATPLRAEGNIRFIELIEFFPYVERELRKTGVTRQILWEEYKNKHPGGVMYSRFCFHFQAWCKQNGAYMHIEHKAGDKLYVDYAGKKLSFIDRATGEIKEAEVFVATLGASQLTYVEATISQSLPDFLHSLQGAFHYFGGVTSAVVPDNLKAAVAKSNKYEPTITERLAGFASHYGTTTYPARVRKPKDKALVEGAVKIVYHRIYAAIRGKEFYSLDALNKAIKEALEGYNNIHFQGKNYSRRDLFEELERDVLKPLPAMAYELKEYKLATAQKNSHVYLGKDKHYYSVPYAYIGKKVKLAFTRRVVEVYYNHKRIALHQRDYAPYKYTTTKSHLPSSHQFMSEWCPEKFIRWAAGVGPSTEAYIKKVLEVKQYPEQGYKSCLGVLGFVKRVGKERLEKACARALHFEAYSYQTIKNILEKGLDSLAPNNNTLKIPFHSNIREEGYYK